MTKKTPAEEYGIDLFYLQRCKEMTPGARLNWLAAAREFALMTGPIRNIAPKPSRTIRKK